MKFELKSIKTYPSLNPVAMAFTANAYVNGKRAFVVENFGKGGRESYRSFSAVGGRLLDAMTIYARSLPPGYDVNTGETYPMDLKRMIRDMITDHEARKTVRAQALKASKKILFIEKGKLKSFKISFTAGMDLTLHKQTLERTRGLLLSGLPKSTVLTVIEHLLDKTGDKQVKMDAVIELLKKEGVEQQAIDGAFSQKATMPTMKI